LHLPREIIIGIPHRQLHPLSAYNKSGIHDIPIVFIDAFIYYLLGYFIFDIVEIGICQKEIEEVK
jgi:hypothetical protein